MLNPLLHKEGQSSSNLGMRVSQVRAIVAEHCCTSCKREADQICCEVVRPVSYAYSPAPPCPLSETEHALSALGLLPQATQSVMLYRQMLYMQNLQPNLQLHSPLWSYEISWHAAPCVQGHDTDVSSEACRLAVTYMSIFHCPKGL